jgi:hypothetical protein
LGGLARVGVGLPERRLRGAQEGACGGDNAAGRNDRLVALLAPQPAVTRPQAVVEQRVELARRRLRPAGLEGGQPGDDRVALAELRLELAERAEREADGVVGAGERRLAALGVNSTTSASTRKVTVQIIGPSTGKSYSRSATRPLKTTYSSVTAAVSPNRICRWAPLACSVRSRVSVALPFTKSSGTEMSRESFSPRIDSFVLFGLAWWVTSTRSRRPIEKENCCTPTSAVKTTGLPSSPISTVCP